MTDILADRICDNIPGTDAHYRLLLVVATSGGGKTRALQVVSGRTSFPYINLNLELGQRLLLMSHKQRCLDVPKLLEQIIRIHGASTVLLDNVEMLFSKSLQTDPLRLLQNASRNTTLVVAWNGKVENGQLTYAEREHREYRHYPATTLAVVTPAETANQ